MDRRSAQQKKGLLTNAEIQVTEWQDERGEAELDQATINREVKTMEEKLNKYNVPTLGEVPTQRDDGSFRILVCQMGGCSGKEIRKQKIAAPEMLINKYKVNLSAFMELNNNWATVASSANLVTRGASPQSRRVTRGASPQSQRVMRGASPQSRRKHTRSIAPVMSQKRL